MKNLMVYSLLICIAAGCSSVTIRDRGNEKLFTEPTWEKSEPFFFWGLVGEAHVHLDEVCGTKPATQLQTQKSALDVVLTVFSLGIYSPRTARVWCD